MAMTNFILTVVGGSAAVLLFRSEVKQSAAIFRRDVRQIHQWLEEESTFTAKSAPKELDSQVLKKDVPKEEKH